MAPELVVVLWIVASGIALVLGFALCVFVHTHNMRRRWARSSDSAGDASA